MSFRLSPCSVISSNYGMMDCVAGCVKEECIASGSFGSTRSSMPVFEKSQSNGDSCIHDVVLLLSRLTVRNRRALVMTDTELKLIAAAAIIGLSSKPKNG